MTRLARPRDALRLVDRVTPGERLDQRLQRRAVGVLGASRLRGGLDLFEVGFDRIGHGRP